MVVSTHSRLKAAGFKFNPNLLNLNGFNTQPPEGGWGIERIYKNDIKQVSTHSRLKAAGFSRYGHQRDR